MCNKKEMWATDLLCWTSRLVEIPPASAKRSTPMDRLTVLYMASCSINSTGTRTAVKRCDTSHCFVKSKNRKNVIWRVQSLCRNASRNYALRLNSIVHIQSCQQRFSDYLFRFTGYQKFHRSNHSCSTLFTAPSVVASSWSRMAHLVLYLSA